MILRVGTPCVRFAPRPSPLGSRLRGNDVGFELGYEGLGRILRMGVGGCLGWACPCVRCAPRPPSRRERGRV